MFYSVGVGRDGFYIVCAGQDVFYSVGAGRDVFYSVGAGRDVFYSVGLLQIIDGSFCTDEANWPNKRNAAFYFIYYLTQKNFLCT